MSTLDLRWANVDTPTGPMLAAATLRGVAALAPGTAVDEFLEALRRRFPGVEARPDQAALGDVAAWLGAFLGGEIQDLPAVDLHGLRRFDASVYRAVREIPAGATATYGDVAAVVGAPRAARAVGGALARCPLFPAVPCHRVVRAADGWSGWGGGNIALKRRLLAAEREGS